MPEFTRPAAEEMRKGTMAVLANILGVPELSREQMIQASLPVSMGGLGLTDPRATAEAAYAGSLALCIHSLATLEKDFWPAELGLAETFSSLGEVDEADMEDPENGLGPVQQIMLSSLSRAKETYTKAQEEIEDMRVLYMQKSRTKAKPTPKRKKKARKKRRDPVQVAPPIEKDAFVFPSVETLLSKPVPQLQKELSRALAKRYFHALVMDDDVMGVTLSDEGKRRLLSASGPGAGAWLTALPTRGDLRMSSADFAHAVRYRLGIVPACMEALLDPSMVCECGKWHNPEHPAEMMIYEDYDTIKRWFYI